jgi:hypothetical protein
MARAAFAKQQGILILKFTPGDSSLGSQVNCFHNTEHGLLRYLEE